MKTVSFVDRVVEVIADRGPTADPRYLFGSGCILVGGTVLTAAHAVAGAQAVWVRGTDKVRHRATVDSRFVGDADGPGPDLALVEISESTTDLPPIPVAVVDRDAPFPDIVDRCHAIGYPWFAIRASPNAVRDTAHVYGYVPVLSKLATGLLSLHVSGPPRPLPPESAPLGDSEWSGMSGAPVLAAGRVFGVVTEHAAREGPSTITVTPLSAIEPDPNHEGWGEGLPNPSAWWASMGVSETRALQRLPPPRVRVEPAYRTTLRRIQTRTRELRGRGPELADIAAFATSKEGYRWYVGDAWTGKTALLASSIATLPATVQVVAYFMSRVGADADSNKFLSAVVPQLADLLDEAPPAGDRHHFEALWERASSAAAIANQHLLLVVDGLDEDLHPAGSVSVAALLPPTAGGFTHVLVSSRPYPQLPADADGHPLLLIPKTCITEFEGAAELAALARQEIVDLKRGDDGGLAMQTLGFLTAAAGPLGVEDLAALTSDTATPTPSHTSRVRRLVTEQAARSLTMIGSGRDRRYEFAHTSLLEYAQADDDLGDRAYRDGIHRWAEAWSAGRWHARRATESSTPLYLLDAYPATLLSDPVDGDGGSGPERLGGLVSDIGWVDAAVTRVGVDTTLASLRTAAQLTPADESLFTLLRAVEHQAHHLRRPDVPGATGYAATSVAWRALTLGSGGLADVAGETLRCLPVPQLVPLWTTERTSPGLASVLGRHEDCVGAVALTGGGLVVSGGYDGSVRVWDPHTPGDAGRELGHHDGKVRAVAVTTEGWVVSGGDDRAVRLWNPRAGAEGGRELGRHDGWVLAVGVTSQGWVVSGGYDGAVRLWDPRIPDDAGRELGRHRGSVWAVGATGGGRVVSGGYDGAVRLWDPQAVGDSGRELGHHDGWVRAVAVTADGLVVSAGDDTVVRLWDPDDPDDRGRELGRHDGSVLAVDVTGDGLVISGGDDKAVRLWDPDDPSDPGRELGRQGLSVRAVAATADGLVVSGGYDGVVRLWDRRATDGLGIGLRREDSSFRAAALTAKGLVISGDDDGAVRLWDPRAPSDPGRELGRHDRSVRGVAAVGDGLVVSGGYDRVVRVWDPHSEGGAGRELVRHDGRVRAVAVTAKGLVVSGDDVGVVRLSDPRNPGHPGWQLGHHDSGVLAVAVTPDGRVLSVGDDGVRLWDPDGPSGCGAELACLGIAGLSVAATAGGLVVSGGQDGAVRVWDPRAPSDPGRELGRHPRAVWAVAVTENDLVLSGGGDGTVRLWNPAAPGDPGRELARHDGVVRAITVADDRQLAVVTTGGVALFEMTS